MTETEERNDDLRAACNDLRALRLVVQTVEAHPDHCTEREMLSTVRRALEAVTKVIQEIVRIIDEELIKGGGK